MAHLGETDEDAPYRSIDVIENTSGIDVVLDGHSHSVIMDSYKNKDGKDVILTQTGTKMQHIGVLVIRSDGGISCELIDNYSGTDQEMTDWIDKMEGVYTGFLGDTIFTIDKDMPITDENGIRMIRSREMGIGDFCADAYRITTGADIGLVNGGGVRDGLAAGDISTINLINVNPFGNLLCVVEMSGQEIIDFLEYANRYVCADYCKDGQAVGEYGSFMQVSGIKFTIDTGVEADVETDENDNLIAVNEIRRISDVEVLTGDHYEPIDPDHIYSVASNSYFAKNGGCGTEVFLKDHNLLIEDAITDYEALVNYARDNLNGDLSAYYQSAGRITLK